MASHLPLILGLLHYYAATLFCAYNKRCQARAELSTATATATATPKSHAPFPPSTLYPPVLSPLPGSQQLSRVAVHHRICRLLSPYYLIVCVLLFCFIFCVCLWADYVTGALQPPMNGRRVFLVHALKVSPKFALIPPRTSRQYEDEDGKEKGICIRIP